jgi:hypothetical protein
VEEADLVILPTSKGTLNMVFTGSVETSTATPYATRETFKILYAQALGTLKIVSRSTVAAALWDFLLQLRVEFPK